MLPYRVIRKDEPCYWVGGLHPLGSDRYFWVFFTHMSPEDVVAYRVEQARVDAIGISPALREAILGVLESGAEVTCTPLPGCTDLTNEAARMVKDQEIGRLVREGHALRNGCGVACPPAPQEPSPKRVQWACGEILRFLSDGAWHTRDEIGTAMGLDENRLRRPLDLLVKEHRIECERRRRPRVHCVFRSRPPMELSLRLVI